MDIIVTIYGAAEYQTQNLLSIILFFFFVVACIPNESIKLIMALHYVLLSPWQLYSGIVVYACKLLLLQWNLSIFCLLKNPFTNVLHALSLHSLLRPTIHHKLSNFFQKL